MMGIFKGIVFWLFYFITGACFLAFAVPFSLMFFPKRKKVFSKLLASYMKWTVWCSMSLLRIIEIKEFSGIEKVKKSGIIISNHQSFLDVFLLIGNFNCIPLVKDSYKFNPIFAWVAMLFEFVGLKSTPRGITEADKKIRNLLQIGELVYICPEGTRSLDGKIQKFNSLAFKIAKDMQVPVFPIVIHYSKPFMSKSCASFFESEKIRVKVRVLDEILPVADETTGKLLSRAREVVEKSYQQLQQSPL
jgi:1-acyl-sn-glycerol-3-phosphate acyltransferase